MAKTTVQVLSTDGSKSFKLSAIEDFQLLLGDETVQSTAMLDGTIKHTSTQVPQGISGLKVFSQTYDPLVVVQALKKIKCSGGQIIVTTRDDCPGGRVVSYTFINPVMQDQITVMANALDIEIGSIMADKVLINGV